MWDKNKLMFWLTYLLLGILSGLGLAFIFKNYNAVITFCNDNEGFFSALLGFLAIFISVITYINQKKEQTKNAQESAQLQRELTEQNNQFQADLQIRQIKLDKYNLLITNWRNLYNLKIFIIILSKSLEINIQAKECIVGEQIKLDVFYYLYKNFTNENNNEVFLYNMLSYLNELNFLSANNKFQKINIVLDLIIRFYMLIRTCNHYAKNNFSTVSEDKRKEFSSGMIKILKLLYDNLTDILKELEKEIYQYDLKSIQNIEQV